jgi:anti-sigma-K factor RskA
MSEHLRPELNDDDMSRRLRSIGSGVADEDFQRDDVPPGLWSAIESELHHDVTNVVSIPRPRGRILMIAAAAVLVLVAGIGGVVATRHTSTNVVAETALSNKGLSPLGAASSGKAEVVRRGASYLLHLDVSHVPQEPTTYVEVWLIDRQVQGMVSLGPYHGDGDYVIPTGVDPAKFPVVDVSIEPTDGVPTHSGVSIVRGVIDT